MFNYFRSREREKVRASDIPRAEQSFYNPPQYVGYCSDYLVVVLIPLSLTP